MFYSSFHPCQPEVNERPLLHFRLCTGVVCINWVILLLKGKEKSLLIKDGTAYLDD